MSNPSNPSNPSNASTVESPSQISIAAPSVPTASSSAPPAPANVVTYSYASRLVFVAPTETYDVRPLPIHLPLRQALLKANHLTD